jgi:hypothetical protein
LRNTLPVLLSAGIDLLMKRMDFDLIDGCSELKLWGWL